MEGEHRRADGEVGHRVLGAVEQIEVTAAEGEREAGQPPFALQPVIPWADGAGDGLVGEQGEVIAGVKVEQRPV